MQEIIEQVVWRFPEPLLFHIVCPLLPVRLLHLLDLVHHFVASPQWSEREALPWLVLIPSFLHEEIEEICLRIIRRVRLVEVVNVLEISVSLAVPQGRVELLVPESINSEAFPYVLHVVVLGFGGVLECAGQFDLGSEAIRRY